LPDGALRVGAWRGLATVTRTPPFIIVQAWVIAAVRAVTQNASRRTEFICATLKCKPERGALRLKFRNPINVGH
jgi:hypothetical protein